MDKPVKFDKQGHGYYTPKQVIEIAQERGLPARLLSDKRSILPQSTVEALGVQREWSKYYPHEYPKVKQPKPQADPFHFGHPVDPEAEVRVQAMERRRAEKRKVTLVNTLAKLK